MNRSEIGVSLLELVVGLLLLSLAFVVLLHSLRVSSKAQSTLSQKLAEEIILSRSEDALKQAVTALDSHRLNIPPRVHKNGSIRSTDGSVFQLAGRFQPRRNSDAITAIELVPQHTLRIIELSESNQGVSIVGCPRYRSRVSYTQYRSMLGLHPDGFLELPITSRSQSSYQNCLQLDLRFDRSLIVAGQLRAARGNILTLVPIKRVFTYYVDGDGRLRYLSTIGSTAIENQPVLAGLGKLALSIAPTLDRKITLLTGLIELPSLQSRSVFTHNHLGRISQLNFLFNQL